MLIQKRGSYYGDIPVKLSFHSREPSSVFAMIGDGEFRIVLNQEEIRELHRLLESFVSEMGLKERL